MARTVQFRFVETRDSRIESVKNSMQETGKSLFAMDGVQIFSSFRVFARMDAECFYGVGASDEKGAPLHFF